MMDAKASEAAKILQTSFGLNNYQARAYVAVVSGCRTAKEVSSKTGIPITRVYDTLNRLAEMGFVEKTQHGYRLLEPIHAFTNLLRDEERRMEKVLEEKKRNLERLVRLLNSFKKQEETETETSVLKGVEPVVVKTLEVCGRGSVLVFAVRKAVKLKQIFKEAIQQNQPKKIYFILHPSITLDADDEAFFGKLDAKAVQSPTVLLDMLVTDAGDALIGLPLDDEPVAVWVRHRGFANSLMQALLEQVKG